MIIFLNLKGIESNNILNQLNTNAWFNIQAFLPLLIIFFILHYL